MIELGLEEYADSHQAFTVSHGKRKIVFINIKAQDKLCSLLHETAHILLGHLKEDERISNKREQELQAEAFTYFVLNYKKPKVLPIIVSCLCGIMLVLLGIYTVPNGTAVDVASDVSPIDIIESNVYVTPMGEKYHRKDCFYIRDKDCMELTVQEAEKNYDACLVCNP